MEVKRYVEATHGIDRVPMLAVASLKRNRRKKKKKKEKKEKKKEKRRRWRRQDGGWMGSRAALESEVKTRFLPLSRMETDRLIYFLGWLL